MDDLLLERILGAVELIPPGRVASYGDIARVTGTSPRLVGRVMSTWGADVPWWRVVNATGDHPVRPAERWLAHWREEGIAVKASGRGCRIAEHRVDLEDLHRQWEAHMARIVEDDPGRS